ncbi:MAG: NAD(P)-binding protein, partial [Pirellulaceae bacterium]
MVCCGACWPRRSFSLPTEAASRSYDVVVVGAGIAGSIAARKLAEAGRRVLV